MCVAVWHAVMTERCNVRPQPAIVLWHLYGRGTPCQMSLLSLGTIPQICSCISMMLPPATYKHSKITLTKHQHYQNMKIFNVKTNLTPNFLWYPNSYTFQNKWCSWYWITVYYSQYHCILVLPSSSEYLY